MKVFRTAQVCVCGNSEPAHVAIVMFGRSLGISPKRETRAVTIYVCDRCARTFQPAARDHINATAAEIVQCIASAIPPMELTTDAGKEKGF